MKLINQDREALKVILEVYCLKSQILSKTISSLMISSMFLLIYLRCYFYVQRTCQTLFILLYQIEWKSLKLQAILLMKRNIFYNSIYFLMPSKRQVQKIRLKNSKFQIQFKIILLNIIAEPRESDLSKSTLIKFAKESHSKQLKMILALQN